MPLEVFSEHVLAVRVSPRTLGGDFFRFVLRLWLESKCTREPVDLFFMARSLDPLSLRSECALGHGWPPELRYASRCARVLFGFGVPGLSTRWFNSRLQ